MLTTVELSKNTGDWCLMTFSAQTAYIVRYEYELYCVGPGDKTNTQQNNDTIY